MQSGVGKSMKKGEKGMGGESLKKGDERMGGESDGGGGSGIGASAKNFVRDHPVLITGLAIGGASLVAGPFALVAAVQGVGFSSGIAAGSWAAGFMSSYGGAVAAGSTCATLQSIGAAGLGATGTVVASASAAATGGGVAAAITATLRRFWPCKQPPPNAAKENLIVTIRSLLTAIDQTLLPPAQDKVLKLINNKALKLQPFTTHDVFLIVVDDLLASIDDLLNNIHEEPMLPTQEHGDNIPSKKALIKERLIEAKVIRAEMIKDSA